MIKLIKMNLFGINGVKIVIPRGFFSLHETDFGICMSVTSGTGYYYYFFNSCYLLRLCSVDLIL